MNIEIVVEARENVLSKVKQVLKANETDKAAIPPNSSAFVDTLDRKLRKVLLENGTIKNSQQCRSSSKLARTLCKIDFCYGSFRMSNATG